METFIAECDGLFDVIWSREKKTLRRGWGADFLSDGFASSDTRN